MYLKHLSLQNFRNYKEREFNFSKNTTFIVGPNTSGKTNLIEAIHYLSNGQSFRAEKDWQAIAFNENLARIKGLFSPNGRELTLEVILTRGELDEKRSATKKFLVNRIARRRVDFIGNFYAVLFSPVDLDLVVDSPFLRRRFLDDVLEQVDRDYRLASVLYEKALRQRNALLDKVKEEGRRNEKEFEYWDQILIKNGNIITQKREEFFKFLNSFQKELFDFAVFYDKSIISKERLLQYKETEVGAGATLVGPHRDDFSLHMFNDNRSTTHNIKLFGSRGQQRLVVLQLKLLQLDFIEQRVGERPLFLLDDIFSELDEKHIGLVSETIGQQQTIVTATHEEFIQRSLFKKANIIRLQIAR